MKTKFRLLCMAFDGSFVVERPSFDSLQKAWEYENDMGSKWFFYPFRFIVTESGKTIREAVMPLEWTQNQRVKTVARLFKTASEKPENANLEPEPFAFVV